MILWFISYEKKDTLVYPGSGSFGLFRMKKRTLWFILSELSRFCRLDCGVVLDDRLGVKPSTRASGSQPSGNTKKDKIQRPPSSTQKNKVEAHPRIVKTSLKNNNCNVEPKGTASVQHSKLNANSELLCVKCNGKVFTNIGYTWRPTGRTFTIVRNMCPLNRITTTTEVPAWKPIVVETETPKPVVTLVYSRKPRKSKSTDPVSKSKVIKSVHANKKEPSKSWRSTVSNVSSSSLDECRLSKLFSGIWTLAASSI
uniref:Integrase, catalytic region, zinc finger, CCHC-type, peptidase aspartic, catalytic n=1 Tax=Tanacetum cinerariifolium TaxID=118510 RepID=A0A6L2K930_TANCI|nr:integrase, catalytic region, zinc finger, CCHC-type, peptidase aspartic, catalytic [Tanacetum cinerariifolium]